MPITSLTSFFNTASFGDRNVYTRNQEELALTLDSAAAELANWKGLVAMSAGGGAFEVGRLAATTFFSSVPVLCALPFLTQAFTFMAGVAADTGFTGLVSQFLEGHEGSENETFFERLSSQGFVRAMALVGAGQSFAVLQVLMGLSSVSQGMLCAGNPKKEQGGMLASILQGLRCHFGSGMFAGITGGVLGAMEQRISLKTKNIGAYCNTPLRQNLKNTFSEGLASLGIKLGQSPLPTNSQPLLSIFDGEAEGRTGLLGRSVSPEPSSPSHYAVCLEMVTNFFRVPHLLNPILLEEAERFLSMAATARQGKPAEARWCVLRAQLAIYQGFSMANAQHAVAVFVSGNSFAFARVMIEIFSMQSELALATAWAKKAKLLFKSSQETEELTAILARLEKARDLGAVGEGSWILENMSARPHPRILELAVTKLTHLADSTAAYAADMHRWIRMNQMNLNGEAEGILRRSVLNFCLERADLATAAEQALAWREEMKRFEAEGAYLHAVQAEDQSRVLVQKVLDQALERAEKTRDRDLMNLFAAAQDRGLLSCEEAKRVEALSTPQAAEEALVEPSVSPRDDEAHLSRTASLLLKILPHSSESLDAAKAGLEAVPLPQRDEKWQALDLVLAIHLGATAEWIKKTLSRIRPIQPTFEYALARVAAAFSPDETIKWMDTALTALDHLPEGKYKQELSVLISLRKAEVLAAMGCSEDASNVLNKRVEGVVDHELWLDDFIHQSLCRSGGLGVYKGLMDETFKTPSFSSNPLRRIRLWGIFLRQVEQVVREQQRGLLEWIEAGLAYREDVAKEKIYRGFDPEHQEALEAEIGSLQGFVERSLGQSLQAFSHASPERQESLAEVNGARHFSLFGALERKASYLLPHEEAALRETAPVLRKILPSYPIVRNFLRRVGGLPETSQEAKSFLRLVRKEEE